MHKIQNIYTGSLRELILNNPNPKRGDVDLVVLQPVLQIESLEDALEPPEQPESKLLLSARSPGKPKWGGFGVYCSGGLWGGRLYLCGSEGVMCCVCHMSPTRPKVIATYNA